MITIGNIYYFSTIIFTILLILFTFLFLNKKSDKFKMTYLITWAFINFSLHFLKQLVYMDVDKIGRSTAENICAISTIVFPFILLRKKSSVWYDFMYLIGVLGGLAALIYPTEAMNKELFTFESLRFYFCHITILSIPILLGLLKIRKPDIKKWWIMPLCFLGYELIIFFNSFLLAFTGLESVEGYTAFELFIDRNYLNNSFVFGPTEDMGAVGRFIGNLTLPIMRKDIFNIVKGDVLYWPVVWLILPAYVLFVPLYLLFSLPFNIKVNKKRNI